MPKELRITCLVVYSDLWLVVNQINETYRAKEDRMNNYLQVVKWEFKNFQNIQVKKIPRSQNGHADALARLATSEGVEKFDSIIMGKIVGSAIEKVKAISMVIDPKPTWLDKIISYLKTMVCLEDPAKARRL